METFESMVLSALANGKSIEEIAAEMNSTLNKIQNEKTAAQKRADYLAGWMDDFSDAFDDDDVDLNDAAALMTIVVAKDHPDWDIDTINRFMETMLQNAQITARLMTEDPLEVLTDSISAAIKDIKSKSFEFADKNKEAAETAHKAATPIKRDADKIAEFLKHLN